MSLYFVLDESSIVVSGKTYPYRELMRSLGAQYQANDKSWKLPKNDSNLQKVEELCKSIGGGPLKAPKLVEAPASAVLARATLSHEERAPFVSENVPDLKTDGYSIAELMRQAQLAISQSFPRSIWVIGEIQNIKWHASGVYFQLADSKEGGSQSATQTVNATIWRSQLREMERRLGPALKEVLQDGFRVRVLADLTLFKDRAQLSLSIQSIDANFTKGSLALQREKLLKELRAKGLFDAQKRLALPAFPFRIGLLSAEDSRAKSDFLDQLKVYGFPGEVIFVPCQMQGEATLRDVVRGLAELQEKACDLIVITRGGGSAADLRWFDSPDIAYAIAAAKHPILAAIGHHEDVCVAEDICFQREKTPTAAADFIISIFQKTRERIEQQSQVIGRLLNERIKLFEARLGQQTERLRSESQAALVDQRRLITQAESTLEINWQRRLFQVQGRIDQIAQELREGLRMRLEQMGGRLRQAQTVLHQRLELQIQRQLNALLQKRRDLQTHLGRRLDREQEILRQSAERLNTRASLQIERATNRQTDLVRALKTAARERLQGEEKRLTDLQAEVRVKDPSAWLEAGWTQLYDEQGPIGRGERLTTGDRLKARLPGRLLDLRIEDIQDIKKSSEMK